MASIGAISTRGPATFAIQLRGHWPVAAGLAVLVLLVRCVWFGNPVAGDEEQLYSFVAWRMLEGELPYVDWWDRKPFGLFAIYAFAHLVGGPGPTSYQALAAIATFAGAMQTYALARPLADRPGAAVAAAFYVVLISACGAYSGQSEAFYVPLMLAAVLLVRDAWRKGATRRALGGMAICGLALQVEQAVLPQSLFLAAWVLWGQYRRNVGMHRLVLLAAALVALALAPTLAVGLFYHAMGEWDAFWSASQASLLDLAALPAERLDPEKGAWLLPLGMVLAVVGARVLRAASVHDRRRHRFHAAWFGSAVLAALLTGAGSGAGHGYHYAALAPGAALMAAPLLDRRSTAGLVSALLLLATMVHLLDLPERHRVAWNERHAIARFAGAIAPHVDGADKCLFVYDGPTSLYRLTGGCAASRFVEPEPLGVSQSGEIARIVATSPSVIVTTDTPTRAQDLRSLRLVNDAVRRDYVPIASSSIGDRVLRAWSYRPDAIAACAQGADSCGSFTRPIYHR